MPRSTLLAAIMIALSVLLTSCADRWRVVRQGDVAAYAGGLAVAPPSFEGTKVDGGTEAEYVEEVGEEGAEEWQDAKKAFSKAFTTAMAARARERDIKLGTDPKGKPTVRARVDSAVVAEMFTVDHNPNYLKTTVVVAIEFTDASGKVVDEIAFEHSEHTYGSRPAAERFAKIAQVFADITTEYLKKRLEEAE